jgi:hypothetical protein
MQSVGSGNWYPDRTRGSEMEPGVPVMSVQSLSLFRAFGSDAWPFTDPSAPLLVLGAPCQLLLRRESAQRLGQDRHIGRLSAPNEVAK